MSTIEQLIVRIEVLEKQLETVMLKLDVEKPEKAAKEKKAKDKKEEKAKKTDEPKKKRGVSGYLVFAKETRPAAKDSLVENGNETPKPTEVLTEVARMWRELSDDEKAVWNEKAKEQNSSSEEE